MGTRLPRECRRAAPTLAALAFALIACGPPSGRTTSPTAPVLLFTGTGTSPNDVTAFERILDAKRLQYAEADSRQMNAMTAAQLKSHRLLIVPGGNFEVMGKGLAPGASAAIRDAVQSGLNYLGVCAGAFIAGASPYNGINLTSGVKFGFYSISGRGVRKAAVAITTPGSPTLEHYWEDGPQLTGWGEIVAKYPDGTPAVVQGTVGSGWVVLSGVHPEAPESWRGGMTFTTPAEVDNEYAALLIDAALNRTQLPHY